MRKIIAHQVADSIDIKLFRKEYAAGPLMATTSEIFYNLENQSIYLFSYGVVVFDNYDDIDQSKFLQFVLQFSKNPLKEKFTEEFVVHDEAKSDKFGYNEIFISKFDLEVLRIIMLNVGQSVALDYYEHQTNWLLQTTNKYTLQLEKNGKLDISSKKLLQFIGKTLNVKNSIVDSLYIVVSPDETWENEYLLKIDTALKNTFDLNLRFKDIDYSLKIVKENLETFRDLMQHQRSNLLEIIIIILILVEVIDLFIGKFF